MIVVADVRLQWVLLGYSVQDDNGEDVARSGSNLMLYGREGQLHTVVRRQDLECQDTTTTVPSSVPESVINSGHYFTMPA